MCLFTTWDLHKKNSKSQQRMEITSFKMQSICPCFLLRVITLKQEGKPREQQGKLWSCSAIEMLKQKWYNRCWILAGNQTCHYLSFALKSFPEANDLWNYWQKFIFFFYNHINNIYYIALCLDNFKGYFFHISVEKDLQILKCL